MIQLKRWQWIILATPVAAVLIFLLVAAGWQIHQWNINWIWGIFTLVIVGCQWLLVRWTRPMVEEMENVVAEVEQELAATITTTSTLDNQTKNLETTIQQVLKASRNDPPFW